MDELRGVKLPMNELHDANLPETDTPVATVADFLDSLTKSAANFTAEWIADPLEYIIAKNPSLQNTIKNEEHANHASERYTNDINMANKNLHERGIHVESHSDNVAPDLSIQTALKGIERECKRKESNIINQPQWESVKKRYQELQQDALLQIYRNNKNSLPKNYFSSASIIKYLGYGIVFTAGPYVGNKLYEKALAWIFAQNRLSQNELINKISELEERCNLLDEKITTHNAELESTDSPEQESKLKTLIQNLHKKLSHAKEEIKKLEAEMTHPTKPSKIRAYAGVLVRACSILATTYLFYKAFNAIDERYLSDSNDNPDMLKTLAAQAQELTNLERIKKTHDEISDLQKIKTDWQSLKNLNNIDQTTKETIESFAYKENSEQNRDDVQNNKQENKEQQGAIIGDAVPQNFKWLRILFGGQ